MFRSALARRPHGIQLAPTSTKRSAANDTHSHPRQRAPPTHRKTFILLCAMAAVLWTVTQWNKAMKAHPQTRSKPVHLFLAGDLLFASRQRNPAERRSNCEERARRGDASEAWGVNLEKIRGADFKILNLETPLSDEMRPAHAHASGWKKRGGFLARPDVLDMVDALGPPPKTALSLSNNHLKDVDLGVEDTIKFVQKAGFQYAGAGATLQQAMRPVTLVDDQTGLRIAFLSASDLRSIRDLKSGKDETREFAEEFSATTTKSGLWDLHTVDFDSLILADPKDATFERDFAVVREQVQLAKASNDLVIFYLHGAPNLAGIKPTRSQQRFGHLLMQCGVDLVVYQHPHHFRTMEPVQSGKAIMYGIGEALRAERGGKSFIEANYTTHYQTHIYIDPESKSVSRIELDLVRLDPDKCKSEPLAQVDTESFEYSVRVLMRDSGKLPGLEWSRTEAGVSFDFSNIISE